MSGNKVSNFDPFHASRSHRGAVNPRRAAPMLPIISDGSGNEVPNASEILFAGGAVDEPEDGVARVTIGAGAGGNGGGIGTSSGSSIKMFNNAGAGLNTGDVVVVDETLDNAVTTTTVEGDTRIAGVVQEPINDGKTGLVLFNGYTASINAPDAVRGEYALTSTSGGVAGSVADRQAGTFAVYLTGTDFPDFVTDSAVTQQVTPVESLSIAMPASVPIDRILLLALWLIDGTSAVDVPGYTLIGAEAGFNYYYRVSTGTDGTTASWTLPSVAVAIVALLHPTVSLATPIEDHDYENTTTAASLAGLSDVPHYAIAGVRAEVASPGSGFTFITSGVAEFEAVGTPSLIQSKYGNEWGVYPTFDAPVTVGNVVVAVPWSVNHTNTWSTDPRQGGTCPPDSNMVQMASGPSLDIYTDLGSQAATGILAKVAGDTYQGPYYTLSACDSSWGALTIMEFENLGVDDYEILHQTGGTTATVNLGSFTAGPNDVVVMTFVSRNNPGAVTNLNGFTEVTFDAGFASYEWTGYKIGSGSASITFAGAVTWGAAAVLLKGGTQATAGTLAGKYIGHDASVTSPFAGAGNEDDAIIAFTLLQEAKSSALLYGPDLSGNTGPTASYSWQTLFNSGDGTALIDSGTGNPISAFAPV